MQAAKRCYRHTPALLPLHMFVSLSSLSPSHPLCFRGRPNEYFCLSEPVRQTRAWILFPFHGWGSQCVRCMKTLRGTRSHAVFWHLGRLLGPGRVLRCPVMVCSSTMRGTLPPRMNCSWWKCNTHWRENKFTMLCEDIHLLAKFRILRPTL